MTPLNVAPLITIHIAPQGAVKIEQQNVRSHFCGPWTLLTRDRPPASLDQGASWETLARELNGVAVYQDADWIKIYVDPFRTIPLFYSERNGIQVCSDIGQCVKVAGDQTLDPVGFWELIKYGICLGNRTLFKKVKQLPGASCLELSKRSLACTIKEYWDYRPTGAPQECSLAEAVEELDARLKQVFAQKIGDRSHRKFLMGSSGGLDSRLSLHYLSQMVEPERLALFTFGNDARTLEYKYAREVVAQTPYAPPRFCRLDQRAYGRAAETLPALSAGHINLLHGHVNQCLEQLACDPQATWQVANYFTDALFGWCCVWPMRDLFVSFQDMADAIRQEQHLLTHVKDAILEDLAGVLARGKFKEMGAGPYSSFFEYFYLAEKNIKMHSYVMHLQSTLLPVVPAYADYDLAQLMLRLPTQYRRGKDIIHELLSTRSIFARKNLADISSRDFRGATSKFSWKTWGGAMFKLKNRLNALVSLAGLDSTFLHNWQQTEDVQQVYHRQFRKELRAARQYLASRGVMDPLLGAKRFSALRMRPTTIGENLQVISTARGLRSLERL